MTDDRSLERIARAWIEAGPTTAPDHAVEAALLRVQTTSQERNLVPWRLPSMNPAMRLAAIALAVIAVGGTSLVLRGGIGGPPTASPSPSPTPSPTIRPVATPRQFTGACTLITRDEAEEIAGDVGLGALPFESDSGDVTRCQYSDGGGNVVLRLTWTRVGGAAAFDIVRGSPGVETIVDLGDEALYDPATHTLHVRTGDAVVAIVSSRIGSSPADRRLDATRIGELVATRM